MYAMRITEAMTFDAYATDPRFEVKKPFRRGSRKQSCGDNIYFRDSPDADWCQRDSFHSTEDGHVNPQHVTRDTRVNRVLISNDFIYLGGTGPAFPGHLRDQNGRPLCRSGIGRSCFDDPQLVEGLEQWVRDFGLAGYQGAPHEWISLRG